METAAIGSQGSFHPLQPLAVPMVHKGSPCRLVLVEHAPRDPLLLKFSDFLLGRTCSTEVALESGSNAHRQSMPGTEAV